jgi:hypothetical protein
VNPSSLNLTSALSGLIRSVEGVKTLATLSDKKGLGDYNSNDSCITGVKS